MNGEGVDGFHISQHHTQTTGNAHRIIANAQAKKIQEKYESRKDDFCITDNKQNKNRCEIKS